jgi:DNA-binding NarL/FixJ family response regulator
MQHCRILLANGHPVLLGVIGRFLSEVPGIQVVARAGTGSQAMSMVDLHRPDLLLMNLVLPDMSGLEVTRRLAAVPWTPRIVVMSLHDEPEYRRAVQAAGADGLVLQQDLGTKLLPLIRSLMKTPSRRARAGLEGSLLRALPLDP